MKATLLFPTREIAERYYLPLIYTACRTCYSELEPQDIFERATERPRGHRAAAGPRAPGHRVGPRLDHRAHRLHLRHQRRDPHAVAPARPPSRRPGLRPAVPALRRLQGARATWSRASVSDAEDAVRERFIDQLSSSLDVYEEMLAGGHPRRGRPLRDAQRDPHEPGDDDEPAGAHPHVRPAPVHDGPVGDPAALPAHPPRGLHGQPVPGLVPGTQVRARSATATRTATATSTAPSGRTRTTCWAPGPRSAAAAQGDAVASCRRCRVGRTLDGRTTGQPGTARQPGPPRTGR